MLSTISIAEALTEAAKILQANQIPEPRRDANLLLAFVLERDRTFLLAHDDYELNSDKQKRLFELIAARAQGSPVQYLTGKQEFFGLEFEVNESVLIPRPETEIMVEIALEILQNKENQYFCDVGTGSGCIAVSILSQLKNAKGAALDISAKALAVARRNAEKHSVSTQITFHQSNLFETFKNQKSKIKNQKFSMVVSNPPYIPESERPGLQREVRDFEPHTALFAGHDGLDIVRRLLSDAPEYLEQNGFLLFEIGFGQSTQVVDLIDKNVWQLIEIRPDLQGIPRMVVLQCL
jgi:release factor glutamine methyltransferase